MAKDRQLRAGSSTWAKSALVLLAGGLLLACVGIFVHPIAAGFSTVVFGAALFSLLADRFVARQQKQTSQDLAAAAREHEARVATFRSVIAKSSDAFCEIDRAGIILYWSKGAEAMFGYSATQAIGADSYELLIPAENRQGNRERVSGHFGSAAFRDGVRMDTIALNSAGDLLRLDVTIWVEEIAGELRMSMIMRNQTEAFEMHKAAEHALLREEEALMRLQEIERTKNDFTSSVSHELRSPLTSTLGYLELLQDGDAGNLTKDQLHMITVAARNARRLQALIEDLLTISRIEGGSYRVQFRPIEIHSTILSAVQQSISIANDRNVDLKLEVEPSVGLMAGDASELSRALHNIINNAVKFTPPGGSVDVKVVRESDDRLTVNVKDTGIGIPSEEQAHLFNRFYRASAAVQNQHQGAGLGLAIAKSIIDHHGGTITVFSGEAIGTTVAIELPALPLEDDDAPVANADLDAVVPS